MSESVELATTNEEWDSSSTLRSLLRNPLACVGLALMLLVLGALVAAIVIGWVSPHAAVTGDLRNTRAPVGTAGHLLGTDLAGRDVLLRVIVATRATMFSALLALVVAIGLGVPAGLVAGYYGRWIDLALDWIASLVMSLPALVLLMAIITSLGTSMWITMTSLGAMMAPSVFRLVRSQVIAVRRELYIDAAIVSGLHDARILTRHVLRVVRGPLILMVSLLAAAAVMVQTGLDFIGLGDPSTITWGGMLNEGFAGMSADPYLFAWPGLAMSITIAAFLLVANGTRDALQAHERPETGRRQRSEAHTLEVVSGAGGAEPSVPPEALLAVRNLTVAYPSATGLNDVVRGATLELTRGSTLGLVGESGSGKTQTAFAVLDLLPPNAEVLSGEIWLDGVDLLRLGRKQRERRVREAIAYVPQEPMSNLDPAFTIGYQLTEPLRHRGASRRAARERSAELLRHMGIDSPERVMKAYPHQISGGMAQRVLIAGAVSLEPRILIADEPTTALDVTVQCDILDLLRRLQDEFDMSVLLVTHNLGVVADLCSDVSVMRAGRVVESAPVLDFFARPRHEYSRKLLESVPDENQIRPAYRDADEIDSPAERGLR